MPSTVMQIKKTIPTLNTDSKGQNSPKQFTRRREIQPKSRNVSNMKTTADYLLIFSYASTMAQNMEMTACWLVSLFFPPENEA